MGKRFEHYNEKGEWAGSTDIPGNTNVQDGWIYTHTPNGTISTRVETTNQFDYKSEDHPPKSIEQIQNEKIGNKFLWELFGKIYKPLAIICIIGFFIYIGAIFITLSAKFGVSQTITATVSSIKTIALEIFGSDAIPLIIYLSICLIIYIIYKAKKKSKKKK